MNNVLPMGTQSQTGYENKSVPTTGSPAMNLSESKQSVSVHPTLPPA